MFDFWVLTFCIRKRILILLLTRRTTFLSTGTERCWGGAAFHQQNPNQGQPVLLMVTTLVKSECRREIWRGREWAETF